MVNGTPLRCFRASRVSVLLPFVDAVQVEVLYTQGVGPSWVDAVQVEMVYSVATPGPSRADSVVVEVVYS